MSEPLHLDDPDKIYEAWQDALAGLSNDDAFRFNARLVLLLANRLGDSHQVLQCIALAHATATKSKD